PTPLLPPDAPVVIDPDLVRSLWASTTAGVRGRLAAEHATCGFDLHRIKAALEQFGVKAAAAQPEPIAAAAPAEPCPQEDDELATFMQSVKTYGRVESLVAALEPEPVAEALHLADLVDANVALRRQRAEIGDGVDIDFDTAERRVKLARIEAAVSSGAVGPDARYE